ncbi:hypothetical protein PQG02_35815 (plasmid) [Nostoc sp. UHCC 0926]|uniref:hypothetical protein n=1 Tax=Nostoc sp. UHCC 0926 TaxID=3025190 RepID=UPI00235E905E|nr:hypothetical protein [Nostoc sp. UHCC 0926]WDD37071.1 hypothetical protein PQG02_35815 [Nostoc sp. UHCC 0926]
MKFIYRPADFGWFLEFINKPILSFLPDVQLFPFLQKRYPTLLFFSDRKIFRSTELSKSVRLGNTDN